MWYWDGWEEEEEKSQMATSPYHTKQSQSHYHDMDGMEFQQAQNLEDDLFNLELRADDGGLTTSTGYSITPDNQPDISGSYDVNVIIDSKKMLQDFFKSYKCKCLIPESGKIVVLDTRLPVKAALQALEENNVKSAPLWDSSVRDYVGIITVSDFIEILLHFHNKNQDVFQELEKHQIKTWREIIATMRGQGGGQLIYADPEETLYDASLTLLKYRIHRLPIIDRAESNSILHIITHYRILSVVMEMVKHKPASFQSSIGDLPIGTFKHVVTVFQDTPISVVLTLLAERKISAVPIIDANGFVIDIYSRSDVTALVKQITFNFLNKPVREILEYKKKEKVHTCFRTETLEMVLQRLIETRVYRLVCVDRDNRVEGIISLSDILQFLIGGEA
eukprot:TRINITY_DN21553_c0_g1_i1.p2 TRINITY_DN21553_c0_g1~~TRINITY_DN21553_c0_g1_i1.p2  ORF type:complete len:391 (-),score=99.35 TRINITY_DN21553_c0_g1_i1:1314-2486(-)